jgi:hypothetical protein
VGYNNGYPNSLIDPTASGCLFSPVFANVATSGTAALGVLEASASADMTSPLIQAGANITVGWSDTFTTLSGGTYLLTFNLNVYDSVSPSLCPGGNPLTRVIYGNEVLIAGTNYTGLADWDYNDCNASTQEPYAYGSTALNNDTVPVTLSLGAGATFTVSSSLELEAGAGSGESSLVDGSTPPTSISPAKTEQPTLPQAG